MKAFVEINIDDVPISIVRCIFLGEASGGIHIGPNRIEIADTAFANKHIGELIVKLWQPPPRWWQVLNRWRWWCGQRSAVRSLVAASPGCFR